MKANQMCFVSLPVSRVRELPRRRRRHPRRAALTAAAFIYIYITYMQTQHTATHSCIYTIVYVSVRISDCAKPDPICIRLCCRFNYTPIPTKSGSGIQLRPLLCVHVNVGVCMCVPEHSPVLASPKTQ